MIEKTNLKDVLSELGYANSDNRYEKKYPDLGVEMAVDFSAKKLIFPSTIKGGDRNTGFNAPENFVVFECVDRLLKKGYRPEHIELEKEWHLGHDAKSGRADICVSDENGDMLFIIECKTWGKEFEKAYKDTLNDGAQLFSYWQQEQSTKWLTLYASNYDGKKVEYKSPTIDCSDDANILLLAKKDKTIKLYKDAHTTSEKYETWAESYSSLIHDDIIFSEESVAYKIGVKPLRKKDLKDFTPEDQIVNKFEEILRHNNVSDKENAFNRLIALFICKLVDESTKGENDEVEFQYKQGTDTYETLQDRLQRLHKDGMEKFMREEIYYVPADYPEWLFSTYTGSKRKKAIEDLKQTIRALKFYSNNDFAFKDVHNEELFYQNGKILVEMVQLFEKYRIVYSSKHQFLGDLFEKLLKKGFKQNEGQFFTPMPITRFIWDSLPVDRMVESERGTIYPKVIDYACGAGHFLTEAVEAINYYAKNAGDNSWARDSIFGIEKDYRLARVAKISLYMNGAGEGNIIFGDGLENVPEKQIDNGSFDILVANPPYSVKYFKQHLQLKNNSFKLLDKIGLNGGEIETLFVERISQLLKPQGIAAVILPSSILSNDSASYTGAREQLLKNFYLRAVVSFGSKTFGATGTNTVVMFLEKFNEPPKQTDLCSDAVNAIFSGATITDWIDKEILEAYIAQIEVNEDVYAKFIKRELSLKELQDNEYFKMYVSAYADSTSAKNLAKTKAYKSKSEDEQKAIYQDRFYSYAYSVESDKLFYFALVYKQTTVIITAPADNKEQKEFLGYDWSNRKGNEGIQTITPGGKMYKDEDREAEGTLACAIRDSFNGSVPKFSEEQTAYGSVVNTKDMFDFSRVGFNKAIRASKKKQIIINSKYELRPLNEFAEVLKGTAITSAEAIEGEYKVVSGGKSYAYTHNSFNRSENIITVSASGANAGYVNFWDEKIFASDCSTIQANDKLKTKWLYFYLKSIETQIIDVLQKGAGQPHVYAEDLKLLPVPKIDDEKITGEMVLNCEKVNVEYESTRMTIEEYHKKIADLFTELDVIGGAKVSLADSSKFNISIGKRVLNRQLVSDGAYPVYSANVYEPFGYINEELITDFSVPSVLWGIDGDWMTNYIPENISFYPTDHCGVLRCKTKEIHPRYLTHVLEIAGKKMGFSRVYRASTDRIKSITFNVPVYEKQLDVVARVEKLEQEIEVLKQKLESLSGKTSEIINNYLN